MKVSLILACIVYALASYAQDSRIGLEFGPTISRTERENHDYYKAFTGISANAFYQYDKKSFFAKSRVGFIQKGYNQELTYVDEVGNILGEGALETVKHNYANVSGLVGVKFGKVYFGSIAVGARLSHYNRTIVSSEKFKLNDDTFLEAYKWTLNYLEPWDVSALAEFSGGYKDELNRTFFVSISYDYGLNSINHLDTSIEDPFRHINLTLQIGFSSTIPRLKKEL